MRRRMPAVAPRRSGWRRLLFWLIGTPLLLVAGAVTFFAVTAMAAGYPEDLPHAMPRPGFVAGAYHVHSTQSDGDGSVEEIAAAARSVGLSFVVLTDHNVPPQPARWVDGVLMIFGTELSTANGHLVAIGPDSEVTAEEREGDAIAAVTARGGSAVLAHPVQTRNPWQRWDPLPKVAGLELYSADTMLREAMASPLTRLLPAASSYLSHSTHGLMSMVAEQPGAVQRLLQLAAVTPTVALCAHDAHGMPDYSDVFAVMTTFLPAPDGFVLPADPAAAEQWVEERLLSGDALCVFRALGPPDGFALAGLDEGSRQTEAGTTLRIVPPRRTPDLVELRVSGAGRVRGKWEVQVTGPGALHIELWRRAPGRFFGAEWKPWIVTSPVTVRAGR